MSSNKTKIIEKFILNESDNPNHQRSSLAVNLSCPTNLTDSESGLLKQIDVKYNFNVPSTEIVSDLILESSKYNNFKDGQMSVNTRCTADRDITLKHANIVLEKIKNDAEILDKNCEKLKQVILTKTKQIFDPQNKLSVKTQEILNAKCNQLNIFQNNDCNKNLNRLCIDITPKDKHKSKNFTEQRKDFKLNKRRLFDMKEDINKSDIIIKCNSPVLHQIQMDKKVYNNTIMTIRNNKKFDNSNMPSNISSALTLDNKKKGNKINCFTRSNDECFLNSNVSDDSIPTAVPIGCSTMINSETLDNNDHEVQYNIMHDSSSYLDIRKGIISMEMTHIQRKCLLTNNQDSLEYNINNVAANKLLGKNVLESNCVHVSEPLSNNFRTVGKFDLFNNITDQSTQILEEYNAGTVQTSLNVNTSVNGSSEDIKNKDIHKQKGFTKKNKKNYEIGKDKNMHSTISEESGKSINTICTSLQVNTSLNALNRLHSQVSIVNGATLESNSVINKNVEENITVNSVGIESTALIKNQKTKNNEIYQNQDNLIIPKTDVIIDKIQDGQSYVEATPYPAYRSVLLKTQLKQNAIVSNNMHINSIDIDSFKSRSSCPKQNVSKESRKLSHTQKKATNESIVLDNSSLHNSSCIRFPIKKSKKKLLPLHDSSQLLSFSPVENENILPERRTLRNRYSKKKKQHVKNKFNTMDNGSSVKHIDTTDSDQLVLKNDHTIFCNTKKQKKLKKVISKKFVIKKFANKNILEKIEENKESTIKMQACISNRSSLNDFQTLRNVPTTRPSNKKTQRINIVVTGLCNDDKNIVKSVVKTLGHARIESNVTKRTTHVITTGVRTINLLHGIIRGCWLVTFEWVLRSLENNSWLNPEDYEITHFSKAVLENRKDRQLFGSSYVPELFAACGSLYIGKHTTPPYNVLKDLIRTAGGHVTESPESAKIIIDTKGLKESWVLDCITTGELQPFHQYQRL